MIRGEMPLRADRVIERLKRAGVETAANTFAAALGVSLRAAFPEKGSKGGRVPPLPAVRAHTANLLRAAGLSLERIGLILEQHHTTVLDALGRSTPVPERPSEIAAENRSLRTENARLKRIIDEVGRLARNA